MNINILDMNELIREKSWGKRNWKWLVPITTLLIFVIALLSLTNGVSSFAQAYTEPELYENALLQAQRNNQVKEILGTLEPIDKLSLLEGNVVYNADNSAVDLTIRIIGSKKTGKMDIYAIKDKGNWEYQFIKIRTKNPKQEVIIVNKN